MPATQRKSSPRVELPYGALMIRIQNLTLPIGSDLLALKQRAAKALGIPPDDIQSLSLTRQSIDARKKSDVHYVCCVSVHTEHDADLVRRASSPHITLYAPEPYRFPPVRRASPHRPVVVGMGPAGLFAALFLARNAIPCLLLERGCPVEARTRDVEQFWSTGNLNPNSNVLFGEGGAGTFSDGKLTTGIHDSRIATILQTLADAGAPVDICYQQKPHVGTDVLRKVVKTLREELLALGCEIRFTHKLTGIRCTGSLLSSLQIQAPQGGYTLPCDTLVLAPGHSARDTFQMLLDAQVPMTPKPFAIGVRIEHTQATISEAQYGSVWSSLPAADYKLACHLPDGRSAFTFCVCPGGEVVAAASEPGHLVTNGMSYRARDGTWINGGFLVGVSPSDFGENSSPLAGVSFQARWEAAAFALGGGQFRAPAQTVGDFLTGVASRRLGRVEPTYRPGVTPTDLSGCLPTFVTQTLRAALPLFERKLHGFAAPEAVMTGVETRSSSPVRILRGYDFQSSLRGLYPCGEGAGYAGGILSAAVDGIKVAEAIAALP